VAAQRPLLAVLAGLLGSKQPTTVSSWPEIALPRIKLAQDVIVGIEGGSVDAQMSDRFWMDQDSRSALT